MGVENIYAEEKLSALSVRGKIRNSLEFILIPTGNENGMTIVVAVMILALVTLLGIAALNTTTTELKISGNDKVYKQAFYNADTGISYAIEAGLDLFPKIGVGSKAAVSPKPADLPANIVLSYTERGGSPRRIEVESVGTAEGGGRSVILAGMVAIELAPVQGPGNATDY